MTRTARGWTIFAVVALFIAALLPINIASHAVAFGINIGALFGALLTVLFWMAVVIGGIWIVSMLIDSKDKDRSDSKDGAMSILRQRYARGEISRTEYFQMRQDLSEEA